ncbi:Type III effector hopAH1 [Pseudomonas syringae pv. delphinii]|uniref:Endoglucanase n=2 Tax=Pseudomonas syringae group genomosp. 3 TaxID=251701 RepID=A0A0P9Q8B0_9PSED|nr:Type III effector hopAH1 [Pseudomonas syringae pv. delphinii]RMP15859.1 Endoglucanase [Pseudomonas syringae pv. delphinii]RMP24260.1 Type III effector hopAH1 [Pseudomonas syringae pv. delphinii]RMQ17309.1 Type III effector hopAH1 [Pseudomonas syringae pv. delphinii]
MSMNTSVSNNGPVWSPVSSGNHAPSPDFSGKSSSNAVHFLSPESAHRSPSAVSWGNSTPTAATTGNGRAGGAGQSGLVEALKTLIYALLKSVIGNASAHNRSESQPSASPGNGHGQAPTCSAASPTSGSSPSQQSSDASAFNNAGLGAHGGANTVPDRIASPDAARKMVEDVKNAGGGTLRIQMTHDQINDPAQMAKLKAMVDAGDKQGVKVQFTFRDNANGGGGNVLTGDKLKQAADDVKNVVSALGKHPSFVLDTFNEGGKSATQDWANMQSTLIKSARDAGYKGNIVVEDSNWGGGLTAGGESGLVKYAAQLKAANGSNNPGLIGSIHEYASGADASSRLRSEIKALSGAGFKPQIGEVGNANWTGGSNFEQRDGANQAVKDNMGALKAAGADVLPWMDQFQDGKIKHDVGFSKGDQFS